MMCWGYRNVYGQLSGYRLSAIGFPKAEGRKPMAEATADKAAILPCLPILLVKKTKFMRTAVSQVAMIPPLNPHLPLRGMEPDSCVPYVGCWRWPRFPGAANGVFDPATLRQPRKDWPLAPGRRRSR